MKITTDISALFNLKGKTALITGGGAGLGLIITEALVKSGAKIIIVSRKKTNVLRAKDSMLALSPKSSIYALTANLGDETEIAKLVSEVKEITSSIDILVNNSTLSIW